MKSLQSKLCVLVLGLLPILVHASNDNGTGAPENGNLLDLWQWLVQFVGF